MNRCAWQTCRRPAKCWGVGGGGGGGSQETFRKPSVQTPKERELAASSLPEASSLHEYALSPGGSLNVDKPPLLSGVWNVGEMKDARRQWHNSWLSLGNKS